MEGIIICCLPPNKSRLPITFAVLRQQPTELAYPELRFPYVCKEMLLDPICTAR